MRKPQTRKFFCKKHGSQRAAINLTTYEKECDTCLEERLDAMRKRIRKQMRARGDDGEISSRYFIDTKKS